MKILTSLILGATLLVPAALSAKSFEGKVTMNATTPRGDTMPIDLTLKAGLVRVDMQTPQGAFAAITDFDKKQVTMLMKDQRMYMVMPIPDNAMNQADQTATDAKLEKTDEHQKIAGYDATKYVVTSGKTSSDVWATDQLGTFAGFGDMNGPGGHRRPGSAQRDAWQKLLQGKDLFPLRVVTKDANGKAVGGMEVTAVKTESVPDSEFAAPADFQKLDMGAMRMGMPGGHRGGHPPAGGNGGNGGE